MLQSPFQNNICVAKTKPMKMRIPLLLGIALFFSLFSTLNPAFANDLTFITNAYAVGPAPQAVAIADINGDGFLDIITPNFSNNTLTVLTNNGHGGFGSNATIAVGKEPDFVTAVDINNDGHIDLVSVNFGASTLTVLTNDGRGNFDSNATLNVGGGPQMVLAADINGDSKPDLISANINNPSALTIYTNNGKGGFGFNATLTVGKGAYWVVAVDITGDGKMDLVAANAGANTLTVLTNNGIGGFGSNATIALGSSPGWLTAVDVNGDGKPDLVCVTGDTFTVLTNNGLGSFGLSTTVNAGTGVGGGIAADLKGDGNIDLISANPGSWPNGGGNTLTVLTNNGTGQFGFNTTLAVGNAPFGLAAADVNADGKLDLITGNGIDNTVTVLMNTTIFSPATNTPVLSVISLGNNVSVEWPSTSAGWSLQETVNLTNSNWLPSGFDGWPIADNGTNKFLTQPVMESNLFFRLLHP